MRVIPLSNIIQLNSARSYGGSFPAGQPKYGAAHDLEAPVRAGLAKELGTGWVPNAGVSPHFISDPRESVQVLSWDRIGYHLGNGNNRCIGFEVTGYASMTRAEWLAGDALSALRNQAECMALAAAHFGWNLRWLSLAEIAAGNVTGFITHNDARQIWGGTTHTDPGPGYPYDVVMKMVQQWTTGTFDPGTVTNPNPATPGTGGAQEKTFLEQLLHW